MQQLENIAESTQVHAMPVTMAMDKSHVHRSDSASAL